MLRTRDKGDALPLRDRGPAPKVLPFGLPIDVDRYVTPKEAAYLRGVKTVDRFRRIAASSLGGSTGGSSPPSSATSTRRTIPAMSRRKPPPCPIRCAVVFVDPMGSSPYRVVAVPIDDPDANS